MAIYMQFDKIKGDVTTDGFKEWIDLSSMQFGVGRAITMTTGKAANRAHGAPSFSEITVSREFDMSSVGLLQSVVSGTEGAKVTIAIVETSGKELKKYVEYELADVMVSSYSVSSGGGVPSESISLSYTKIIMSYTASDKAGKAGNVPRVTYDLATAKAS
jgi:type VI secretion system secreted protein Hcp